MSVPFLGELDFLTLELMEKTDVDADDAPF
jgi:hypothetical protein